jgi:hypothetical protein
MIRLAPNKIKSSLATSPYFGPRLSEGGRKIAYIAVVADFAMGVEEGLRMTFVKWLLVGAAAVSWPEVAEANAAVSIVTAGGLAIRSMM